jgi:hypothetical protein
MMLYAEYAQCSTRLFSHLNLPLPNKNSLHLVSTIETFTYLLVGTEGGGQSALIDYRHYRSVP